MGQDGTFIVNKRRVGDDKRTVITILPKSRLARVALKVRIDNFNLLALRIITIDIDSTTGIVLKPYAFKPKAFYVENSTSRSRSLYSIYDRDFFQGKTEVR